MNKRDTDGVVELTEAEYEMIDNALGVAFETMHHVENKLIDPLRELIKECSAFGRDQSVVGDKIAAILDEFNKGEFEE